MSVWKFTIQGNLVKYGVKQRQKITGEGCNEPFKDRYWCPKSQWFKREPCPFVNRRECENFDRMCGANYG